MSSLYYIYAKCISPRWYGNYVAKPYYVVNTQIKDINDVEKIEKEIVNDVKRANGFSKDSEVICSIKTISRLKDNK